MGVPDQGVLIDFPARRFYFFFIEIWPQEVYYITGLLIPAALGLGLIGLIAFLWALRSGQFDDMDGAALRILIDDEEASECGEDESVKTTRSDQPPSVG